MSMRIRSLILGFLLVLAVVSGAFSLERAEATDVPRLVSVRLDPKTLNLVFQVEGGAFDPLLSVSPTRKGASKGTFQMVIEGEGIQLGRALAYESKTLSQTLIRAIKEVQWAQLSSTSSVRESTGRPGFKLVIQTTQRVLPQIRSNTGSLVTVSFQGVTAINPTYNTALRGQISEVSQRETRVELPAITLDTSKTSAQGREADDLDDSPIGPVFPSASSQGFHSFSIYEAIQNPAVASVIRQAWGEYRQGRLNSGQMMLESYLGKEPKDQLARYVLALIHLAGDENQRATMALQKTLKLDEAFLPAWIDLVRLNLKEGNFSETDELLEQALVQFPGQPDLLYAKGLLLEAQGEVVQAKDFYVRVLVKDSRYWMAHYRLAITELKANQPRAATVELKRILNANPDDIAALKALGYAYHRDNSLTQAMASYREALKPDVLINFAGLLREQQQEANALALYGAAEVIAPEDPDIQYNLGMLYADMDQAKPAVRTLSRFIALTKANPQGFLGDDERVVRAKGILRRLGVAIPQADWLSKNSETLRGETEALNYQFGVSAIEKNEKSPVPHQALK